MNHVWVPLEIRQTTHQRRRVLLPWRNDIAVLTRAAVLTCLVACTGRSYAQKPSIESIEKNISVDAAFEEVKKLYESSEYNDLRVRTRRLIPLLKRGPKDMLTLTLFWACAADLHGTPVDIRAANRHLAELLTSLESTPLGDMEWVLPCRIYGALATEARDAEAASAGARLWIEHREAQFGLDSLQAALSKREAALTLSDTEIESQFQDAKLLLDSATKVCSRLAGDPSAATLKCKVELAILAARSDDFAPAKSLMVDLADSSLSFEPARVLNYNESLDGYRQNIVDAGTMDRLNMLAIVCRNKESFDLAIPLFRDLLAKCEKQPPDDPFVLRTKSGLGRALVLSGSTTEGMELVTDAYETCLATQGADGWLIPVMLLNRAIVLEIAGRHVDAMRDYSDAVARAKAYDGESLSRERRFADSFAAALEKTGHTNEATELRRRASSGSESSPEN